MTTTKAVGETISLTIKADGGVAIEGAKTPLQPDGYVAYYTLTSQTIIIRGDVTELKCRSNQLTSLDVSGCTTLTILDCWSNLLTSLDVSGCTALTKLDCSDPNFHNSERPAPLTSLKVNGCTSLTELYCYGNQLTSLDLSGCTALTTLSCSINQLTNLDVSGCAALTMLNCSINQLTNLDVSQNNALKGLGCGGNQLTSLDVSKNVSLTNLDCGANQLTSLDLSHNSELKYLYCFYNQIKGTEMTKLVNSLPKKDGRQRSKFYVVEKDSLEGNVCLKSDVAIVTNKGWTPLGYNRSTEAWEYYGGRETDSFGVSLTHEGEGVLDATGADDLKAVPYGTKLTITATPAEGYELAALTANGFDILESKSFEVTGYTKIKATFRKKTFAISLAKSAHGEIEIAESVDLQAVPYGTTLTISANPETGYELTALTANGEDILATKSFVVKSDTEVKATFSNKTFAVSLTKVGEGTITATGAGNFNAVAYGTELTINATPAAGYKLVSLTANGTDITSSKKVVVKENLSVKATFAKKTFAVTLTKVGEGTVTAAGASNLNAVAYGTELTINATPAAGYELVSLEANGVDITATKRVVVTDNLTVTAIFSNKTYAVTLTKVGEGTITATGASDLNSVAYGTELTINATPAMGYELVSITAGGTDITDSKKVVVTGNLTIKATFAKKNFAVSLTKEGEGTITATGASNLNSVAYGTELTIVVTPAEGYELVSITAGGTDITASKKVVVTGNLTVKATFAKKNFSVSLTKEGEGTIFATGASNLNSVAYGTELTINATPAEGYELTALTANGMDILATKKIVVKDNLTVKATFAKKSFAVSLTKEGEGTITATGATSLNAVAYGTELTINATPAEGYELVSITAGGTDITASRKVVVTGNLTVKATFAKKNFAVSLTKEGEGTITATGASNLNSVAYGTELTINATPAKGYELVSITAGGTDITASKKVVVTGNLTVKATFTKKNFAVSLTKEGEGMITATGASNLNSVAYGTELTINATPAKGYELVSITANGTDITATKKIVVKDNLTVKATFTKKSFAVSLTKEGEGMISATGASNLNSVAYGTELTIVATPAEGYELTALTANGTDILATKKVVVEGNLTVKATFTKKTFAVTLTSNEHGDITIVEPFNLEAVPYGTTLTVKATGKNAQCVLTELTANGKDILATQSFVVTDVTEVKATFVDHTGVETTITQQVKLYPNPATDYVIVEGVAPASEVTLHSMTGERLYAGRADDRGTLQIDLTPYADGVYLVCVAGETYRVVVRR